MVVCQVERSSVQEEHPSAHVEPRLVDIDRPNELRENSFDIEITVGPQYLRLAIWRGRYAGDR